MAVKYTKRVPKRGKIISNTDEITFSRVGTQVMVTDGDHTTAMTPYYVGHLKNSIYKRKEPTKIVLQGLSRAQMGGVVSALKKEDIEIIDVKARKQVSRDKRRGLMQYELKVK